MNNYYMPKDYTTRDAMGSITGADGNLKGHSNKGLLIALSHHLENVSLLPEGGAKNHIIHRFVNPILEEIDKRLSMLD